MIPKIIRALQNRDTSVSCKFQPLDVNLKELLSFLEEQYHYEIHREPQDRFFASGYQPSLFVPQDMLRYYMDPQQLLPHITYTLKGGIYSYCLIEKHVTDPDKHLHHSWPWARDHSLDITDRLYDAVKDFRAQTETRPDVLQGNPRTLLDLKNHICDQPRLHIPFLVNHGKTYMNMIMEENHHLPDYQLRIKSRKKQVAMIVIW